jgi:hypothetical protein
MLWMPRLLPLRAAGHDGVGFKDVVFVADPTTHNTQALNREGDPPCSRTKNTAILWLVPQRRLGSSAGRAGWPPSPISSSQVCE